MAPARTKAPAIGSAQWILDERHQSNDLVRDEVEDFSYSVRNELEWLNEHMAEIFANNGQNNLDVFKTPGKLRGKTPRTARKKNAELRQPLGDIFAPNLQRHASPAQQSLQKSLQKSPAKPRFQVAEDENVAPILSPTPQSPVPAPLFSNALATGKENKNASHHVDADDDMVMADDIAFPLPPATRSSLGPSTQDTIPDTQYTQDTQVFSQGTFSTQPTFYTQSSIRRSLVQVSEDERRDTGESFVSAKEAFASKNGSKEHLPANDDTDAEDVDEEAAEETRSDDADTAIHHKRDSYEEEHASSPAPTPRLASEPYVVSAETHAAYDTAAHIATVLAPDVPALKAAIVPSDQYSISAGSNTPFNAVGDQDDTIVHHDVDDQMDIDEDVRSPSDGSSPVKPLVRKSSLTFASLPAREPLIAKKSMGNRNSRTSHIDANKVRNSQLGRFTGGKSLGGTQHTQAAEMYEEDAMDIDAERPGLSREESETTKLYNKTSTQRLHERINMLKQKEAIPKRASQSVAASRLSQTQTQPQSTVLPPPSQPAYPQLPHAETEAKAEAEEEGQEDDDDWISPVRPAPPAANAARPILNKSHSTDTRPAPALQVVQPKLISVSNPDLSSVVESTTPAGSPTGKKYMDGPLSASKAKFYSALRAAKEKIIGSSATSAQVKLDALAEGPMRPKLDTQNSVDDIFTSPRKNEKAPGTSIFSHLRTPSKESIKTVKSTKAAMPGSPTKEANRRTRSSSERERQKEKDAKEKELKQREKQRADDRLKEMREKEQSKATAHYQKKQAAAKTPMAPPPQPHSTQTKPASTATLKTPASINHQPLSRPGVVRTNTAASQKEVDSGDEMPPPPPPKSLLPTGPAHKSLREPKRLAKVPSKDTIPKAKPQAIKINLNRFGQAPVAASKPAPTPAASVSKAAPPASKTASVAAPKAAPPKAAPVAAKTAPRVGRPPAPKAAERVKPAPAQPRADLATSKPISRMQTVQDANRINIPPVNPAKPAKRVFQPENDEPLHRPVKRPSQQAKPAMPSTSTMTAKPVPATPAHAQFAQGKIPFAADFSHPGKSSKSAKPPVQYPNGEDIKLPDIMTDSEDEDSENEFQQPSWVDTPNLRELLEKQQLVDPETVFGPIAPLEMEKVFPENKERHKRFRDRTSSAYWANDRVTEEERRKEREARERLVRDGAWSYHPSPGPSAA